MPCGCMLSFAGDYAPVFSLIRMVEHVTAMHIHQVGLLSRKQNFELLTT